MFGEPTWAGSHSHECCTEKEVSWMTTGTKEKERAFPPQHQDAMPALESDMRPEPEFEDAEWLPRGDLDGKVALVTGGDSGIGRAVATLFAKEGADVIITHLPNETGDADTTAERVRQLGRTCLTIEGDLSDKNHVDSIAKRVQSEFGRLDVLVSNASVQFPHEDIAETTYEEIKRTLDSNLMSTILITQACLPVMQEGSAVIVTSSVNAYRGSDHLPVYSATKGAQVAFVRSMSKQLVGRGIRVNGVAPGPVWTPLIPGSFPADYVAEFGKKAPMGRAAQPREIAPSYLFLACEKYSSYFTGQVLHPNGGDIVGA
jgi:NAD(P)-dependent dehydrogenase (short-subunit alcohol dehydrogenase family)